jgi:capsular exopolysaccharide synthesis family protein
MSIHDAIKQAEQARDRLREAADAQKNAGAAPVNSPAEEAPATPLAMAMKLGGTRPETTAPVSTTPLTAALQNAPAPEKKAELSPAQARVVESYQPRPSEALDRRLIVYHHKTSRAAAEYRRLRDGLVAAVPAGRPHVLALTSSTAGEGKTTTLVNLGLALAELRALRVCMIDGDFARPDLSAAFALRGKPGLAQLLQSEDACESAMYATPWPNVVMLPAGVSGSAGLLASPRLISIIRYLRNRFDFCLIDTPAAMTHPDAGLFAAAGDGAVLCVAMHRTATKLVDRTRRTLEAAGVKIVGTVLTQQ